MCIGIIFGVEGLRVTPKSQGPVMHTTVAQQVCGVEPLNFGFLAQNDFNF